MSIDPDDLRAIRDAIAAMPADVSKDAHGMAAPTIEELYAPQTHAAALDPATTIVQGARGTGKSFWAGVLGDANLRNTAAIAYPQLDLDRLEVQFGFTGLGGSEGIDKDKLDACVPMDAGPAEARAFWWATILRALDRSAGRPPRRLADLVDVAADLEQREALLSSHEAELQSRGCTLLVVYDALDTIASTWPRRLVLTQALLEVVWSMRAWRAVRPKLFLRPDQLDDEGLQFVELPKLRTGAVRLTWYQTDLYGLLFTRLALGRAGDAFGRLLAEERHSNATREEILSHEWPLSFKAATQSRLMSTLAGRFMASGPNGYKKGKTYDWPIAHLSDAFKEVTPRSFLGLMIGASKHGPAPADRVVTPEGIRHGLREASKTRVDQLHQEFPWIKGMLAPLAGLLLPRPEAEVFDVWARAGTVAQALDDASKHGYLSPFPVQSNPGERDCYEAMARIGVMTRRKDGRLDMPDLFRVAAKLLKKGGTALV
jgi:hypothetical protein